MHTHTTSVLLTELALSLGRNPDEFLDAYGSGDAIAVMEDGRLQAFVFAHALGGNKHRPLSHPVRRARAIDFAWSDPSLGEAGMIMRRKALENLIDRMRGCQLILTEEIAGILGDAPAPITFAELHRSLRFRTMAAFGISHIAANDRQIALARSVVFLEAEPTLEIAPHFCGGRPGHGDDLSAPMEYRDF